MEAIRSIADYRRMYEESVRDPEGFWSSVAADFVWRKKWDHVLQWDFDKPEVTWFAGATLNVTENCIDRHLKEQAEQTAIIWEPNDPADAPRKITYRELHAEVCRVGNMLRKHGVKKGDRVCVYMPMVPELAFALLACARIGAVHSVVFAGFSSGSLVDRIND